VAADESDEQRNEWRNEGFFRALSPRRPGKRWFGAERLRRRGHAAVPFFVPIMYSPRTSSLASGAGITTAHLPRYITAMRSERASTSLSSALTSRIALP